MKPGDLVLPNSHDEMLFNDNLPNHGIADYRSGDIYRWIKRSGMGLVLEVRTSKFHADVSYVKVLIHDKVGWTFDKKLSKIIKDL